MDPKWVMTNEQKKVRFQHYFKKKQERESTTDTVPPTTKAERYNLWTNFALLTISLFKLKIELVEINSVLNI